MFPDKSNRAVGVVLALGATTLGIGFLNGDRARTNAAEALQKPVLDEREPLVLRPNPNSALRVVDEQDRPVPRFEVSILTADHGSLSWQTGREGRITLDLLVGLRESQRIDFVVKAEGYASTVARYSGPDREQLLAGKASVALRQGEEVELRLGWPQGMTVPPGLQPEVYFDDYRHRARIMWQLENHRDPGNRVFEQVGLRTGTSGRFLFRLARESPPFYVAIHAPGLLRIFERGPFTLADVKNGVLAVDVEKPAELDVSFDPGPGDAERLPFTEATITVMRKEPGTESVGPYLSVATTEAHSQRPELRLADLSPGDYQVNVRTTARSGVNDVPGTGTMPINPGVFMDIKRVTLGAGQTERIKFRYAPFDLEAYRGQRTARVRVARPDGKPAADRPVTVEYCDGHYGFLTVYSGKIPESGVLELKEITDRRHDVPLMFSYVLRVGDQTLGSFGFKTGAEVEEFAFGLPPGTGDLAPDIELLRAAGGVRTKLSALRGKVVCLEFWATWCGPCRKPMDRLNELAETKKDAWNDRVAIVALSIDDQPDAAERFVAERGWKGLKPFWAGRGAGGTTGWESPQARAYVVYAVPTTLIIGRDGRIVWRGHPVDPAAGLDIETRIEAAIKP
jgi:thiol-disulfide isomerase/thioredoxin